MQVHVSGLDAIVVEINLPGDDWALGAGMYICTMWDLSTPV